MRIRVNHAIPNALTVKVKIGVRSAGAKSGIRVGSNNLERRCGGGIKAELVGKRQHIKDTEAGANGSLTVFARIPGKTNARFIVQGCGVVGDRTARPDRTASSCSRSAIEKRLNLLESSSGNRITVDGIPGDGVRIGRPRGRFVTQADVEREVWPETPVVLDVARKKALSQPNFKRAAGRKSVQLVRRVGQESRQRIAVHAAVRAQLLENVVLHTLKSKAEFDGVRPAGEKGVVVELDGIPCVIKFVESTKSECRGDSGNRDLGRADGTWGDRKSFIRGNSIA